MNRVFIQVIILTLLIFATPLSAYQNQNIVSGTVGAIGVVLNEDGDPILAEYDSDGNFIKDLNEFTGMDRLKIMSGETYRAIYQIAQDLKQANQGARIMSKAQYKSQTFKTNTKEKLNVIKPDIISETTLSVLVTDERNILVTNPIYESIILQEFPVDLSDGSGELLPANIVSLLVNKDGKIEYKSRYDIAFKIDAFERDENGNPKYDQKRNQIPVFPLPQVGVIAGDLDIMPFGGSISDNDGRYVLPYAIPPCPGFFYELRVPIVSKMPTRNFNPKGEGLAFNTALSHAYGYCVGYGDVPLGASLAALNAQINAIGIVAAMPIPVAKLDLWFSTLQLAAIGTIPEVELTDKTEYQTEYTNDDESINKLAIGDYIFDFDGDENPDIININPDDNTKIDVYLGDNKPTNDDGTRNEPDLTRLADYDLLEQLKNQGLLKTISKTDLQDTDIYIYRNSTNQLVGQIEGLIDRATLADDDILLAGTNNNSPRLYKGIHEDETIATFGFSSLLMGGTSTDITSTMYAPKPNSERRPWQTTKGSPANFKNDKKPDYMRPGETVKIIAINRATGYIGTVESRLYETYAQLEAPIVMGPPNLKVIATRTFNTEAGLEKGKHNDNQLIGNEGAGLTSDEYVKIQTIWLDQDGSPLPDSLPGYTGRVAISTGSQTQDHSGNFELKPGYQTEFIQLNQSDLNTEHFYVQVIGENFDGNPKFISPGAGEGKLQTRPKKYTPIKVPVFNELATVEAQQALTKARQEGVENLPDDVQPVYHWVYRPEMQFSVYELKMQEGDFLAQYEDDDGQLHTVDILAVEQESFSDLLNNAPYIDLIYSLLESDNDPLEQFGPARELILAIGEEEVPLTIEENGVVTFDHFEHLSTLTTEDFLSIRLYQNNDMANVLWKWAFFSLSIGVIDDEAIVGDGIVYLSADNPEIDLSASILGYSTLADDRKRDVSNKINWKVVSGNAQISPTITPLDETGLALTHVVLPPDTNNTVVVEAQLQDDDITKTTSFEIGVISGKPSSITLTHTGSTYLKGRGEITVNATVRDQNSNLVENGTAVQFRERGHINLKSTTGLTENGIVTGVLAGGSIAGSYELEVSSGEASQSIQLAVNPLLVSITGLPSTVNAGTKYELTAEISDDSGHSLEDIFIDLGADAGSITAMNPKTDSNGKVHFTYKAPQHPGTYTLAAKLDLNQPVQVTVNVVMPGSIDPIEADRYYMVSGTNGSSQTNISDFTGATASLNFPLSYELTLNGNPGTNWTIDVEGVHLINREPVYFSRFENLRWDQLRQYEATFESISRSNSPFDGIYALDFSTGGTGQSIWQLKNQSNFAFSQPSYNFWIKPETAGNILQVANGTFSLNFNGSSLTANLTTDTGIINVTQSGINANQWYEVALSVRNGTFYLAVDDQIASTPLNGSSIAYPTISPENNWLVLGDGFTGQIGGLRIYNWDSDPLINLSQTLGVYDPNGKATIGIQLTTPAQQNSISLPAVTVAIRESGNRKEINVLNKQVVSSFSSTYLAINPQSSLTTDEVLEAMPMDEYFPDPRHGAINLAQRFAIQSNDTSARENIIASLAWLSYEPKYAVLHDKVATLQTTFIDMNQPDLAHFAAEYLQEAMVQASYGNPFWLRTMATSFTVWGELAQLRPDLARVLGQAISNRTDFWLWVRILSLPANGWVTDTIPIPRPEITCDQVTPDVNVGSLLEFSSTPCRATGAQMANVLDTALAVDPDINQDKELLTIYMQTLLSSLKQMPLEYKKLFPPSGQSALVDNEFRLFPKAKAAVWFYIIRGMLVGMKQAVKKGSQGAPANFIAFLQGGTTSRVGRAEMLIALAYLGSRLDPEGNGALCSGCKSLNQQVSKTVIEDMAAWYAGIGLANKGDISDGDLLRKSCTITNNAHGKGFELLATAAYHALYEFGGDLGLTNADQYKILLSDPRERDDIIKVGLMKEINNNYQHYDSSPHQRKPDLVLHGEGEGDRTWIELKSWRYNRDYFDTVKNELRPSTFSLWDGHTKNKIAGKKSKTPGAKVGLRYTMNAQRQYFLDHVATSDELIDHHWDGKSYETLKPSNHRTWFQVWKAGKREWTALEKGPNGRYRLGDKQETINVATPWIDTGNSLNATAGLVTSTTPQFRALQKFLASAPEGIDKKVFKDSVGSTVEKFKTDYTDKQITHSFTEFANASILPFTVQTFFSTEVGQQRANQLWQDMIKQFGDEKFAKLKNTLDNGGLSEEQIQALRDEITERMLELLGNWRYLAIDIPLISDVEDMVGDLVLGDEAEKLRQFAADINLDEAMFENYCEMP